MQPGCRTLPAGPEPMVHRSPAESVKVATRWKVSHNVLRLRARAEPHVVRCSEVLHFLGAAGGGLERTFTHAPWRLSLALCIAFALCGIAVLEPGFPEASPNPLLAIVAATLESTVGLLLSGAQLLYFSSEGGLLNLLAGFGFGALALDTLVVRVAGHITGLAVVQPALGAVLLLLGEGVAVGLFLAGLACPGRIVGPAQRRMVACGAAGAVGVAAAAGAVLVLGTGAVRQTLVDPAVQEQLAMGVAVTNLLPGQRSWLIVLDGTYALLTLVAAIGYTRAWHRLASPDVALTAASLSVLSLSQFHTLLFPPVAVQYISTADAFRLAAFLGGLGGLITRLWAQSRERAARDERLRLSRELHDGLAQQLSLLQLQLRRAAATSRPAEAHARDLQIAEQLTESALIEARQTVAVLRSGSISWEQFRNVLARFVHEFATNHEIEVGLTSEGETPHVRADFQRDVLLIVQEAFSNAIRHGAATRITVTLVNRSGWCELNIRDNGRGFEVAESLDSTGVGLDSLVERLHRRGGRLSIESAPGFGAAMQVRLPCPAQEVDR
jgi:signal transduction histidine kinase